MGAKKIVDHIVLFLVGGLFIFSGLIKINDPIGTSIKLEEYFEVFSSDFAGLFHYFIPFSLSIAVVIVILEVILGVAVLLRQRMVLTSWVLLLLIVFFTFLTFFSAVTGKVTDCGCFGDAIKLTPWESFYKDIILLILIIYIFLRRKSYSSLLSKKTGDIIMGVTTATCVFIAIYAINHLPYIDFRAYHLGNNIGEAMKPSQPFVYNYVYEKDGKKYEFDHFVTDDSTFVFKEMVLLNEDALPKITDYNVWSDDGDFTEESLNGRKLFIVIQDVYKANLSHIGQIRKLINELEGPVTVWLLTSNDAATIENFRHEYQIAAPYYYVDATVIKAMIRSNPGIMVLNNGTVLGKWHHNDTPSSSEILDLLELK